MDLTEGVDALTKLVKQDKAATSGAAVPFGGATIILNVPSVDLLVGDVLLVTYSMACALGAFAGWRACTVQQTAGTATIVYGNTFVAGQEARHAAAADATCIFGGTFVFTCTVAGVSVLSLVAERQGGAAGDSVIAGGAEVRVRVLRGR